MAKNDGACEDEVADSASLPVMDLLEALDNA